jgi:putative redox protein
MSRSVVVTGSSGLLQNISVGPHLFQADEPIEFGGNDAGPDPYELFLAGLGACTGMTIRMYAERKGWPLQDIRVRLAYSRIHAEDCKECDSSEAMIDQIEREIEFTGELSVEQRQKLLDIANRCPVHRTLTSQVQIHTRLV